MAERWPALSINPGAETAQSLAGLASQVADLAALVAGLEAQANDHVVRTGDTMSGTLRLSDGRLEVPFGSQASPSYVFRNDTNTGIYRPTGDVLGFVTGGTEFWRVSSAGRLASINNSGVVWSSDGSESVPAFSFQNDSDTGIYSIAANRVGISGGGTVAMNIGSDAIRVPTGDAAGPGIGFLGDVDTGMYRDAANTLGFATAGTSRVLITAANFSISSNNTNIIAQSTGASADVVHSGFAGASGALQKSTSALKYKTHVEEADWLADIQLAPTKHWRVDDKRWRYGLVADELADQDPLLGVYEDGEIENYDTRAVLAVLAAKVNRQENELAELRASHADLAAKVNRLEKEAS